MQLKEQEFNKQLKRKSNMTDEYITPRYGVIPIDKYLMRNSIIWCPFDTEDSEYVKYLREKGHSVVATHIKDLGFESDFFFLSTQEKFINQFDYIISNPPFSKKSQIIERLIDLKIPFAMLLPINILEGVERFKQFKRTNIELLMFDKRIGFKNFEKPEENSKPCVATMYLCSGVLPQKLILETLERE